MQTIAENISYEFACLEISSYHFLSRYGKTNNIYPKIPSCKLFDNWMHEQPVLFHAKSVYSNNIPPFLCSKL